MQAPLSSTASGKIFRNRPSTASPTHLTHFRVHTPETLPDSQATSATRLADGRGLAHDAGNLFGALGLYCELLGSPGVLRDEHRHYAEELRLLSGRSRDLIDRLLNPFVARRNVSAHTSEHKDIAEEQVVVPDVIEGCRGLLNAVARRAVAVAYGAGSALPVAISREALERILINLTKNAAEAMDADQGGITLRVVCEPAESNGQRLVLTVEDKGRGMNSAAVKVLMTPAPPVAQRAASRGLGFQVVRELVGASGGQLRLRSRQEGSSSGTTVEVMWAVASTQTVFTTPFEAPEPILAAARQAAASTFVGRTSC